MTLDDRQEFAVLMFAVAETYGEALSEARLEIYFAALDDLELPEIRASLNVHVRRSKFFPRPAEIREGVRGNVDDRAALAWAALLRMVRRCGYWWNEDLQGPLPWPDDATRRAALELYGGWQALCERLPADGPGFAVAAKLFQQTFSAYARRDDAVSLPGLTASSAQVLTDGC